MLFPNPESKRRRWIHGVVGLLACVLMFAPALAFVFTGPGSPIENRAPAKFSGFRDGWRSLRSFAAYLNDRLPLRQEAVRTDAWIDEHVFREDPAFGGASSPRVIRGKDGFLFLADAIDSACQPQAPVEETAANIKRLATIVSSSGRGMLAMIAPDKSSVHPELLPEGFARKSLFDDNSDRLWNSLSSAGIPGYIDLRDALRTASARSREPLYFRKDSHWDSAGSLVMVRLVVDRWAPNLWSDAEVHYRGLETYTGDLTRLQGRPQSDQAPLYTIIRPDVTLQTVTVIDTIEGGFNRRFLSTSPPGRLIRGHTLLLLDSFGLAALPQIVPYFEDLTVMRLIDFSLDRYTSLIAEADRVWLLTVERSTSYRLHFEIGSEEFLETLPTRLPLRKVP